MNSFRQFPLILLLFVCTVSLDSCGGKEKDALDKKDVLNTKSPMKFTDIHSFSRPEEAVVKHLSLEIEADLEHRRLLGKATWTIETAPGAKTIVFDTKGIKIRSVKAINGHGLGFRTKPRDLLLGSAVEIELTPKLSQIVIEYSTTAESAALQWLKPEQTSGKKSPFLFTQSQAILARTWIPCQDSPGIRFTYDAKVKTPAGLMAVMSASNPTEKSKDNVYSFKMEQPIPSYLMALAVGDIVFKPIGERTGVYAEPATINAAFYEFADMEKMLVAAEELYGPYAWERYDVIVLPPSFPFGGMENPRLTFATPTILAGDRSLTSLVAHELAHSWSGNLVTNATWNDFWLNEGFTVYFERRIMEKLYGEDYYNMLRVLGYQELKGTIEELMKSKPDDTRLKLDLKGRDPDDGLTDIAYEKGCLFLTNIERIIGREKFDEFLRNYFKANAFKVMTTDAFIEYLNSNLIKGDQSLSDKIAADKWIFGQGLPEGYVAPESNMFQKVDSALTEWKNGTAPEKLETKNWSTHEWLHFIRHLPQPMSAEQMRGLDKAFGYTTSGNSEILGAWFPHVIGNDYQVSFSSMEKFLTNVGRRKFVKPLYQELSKNPAQKEWALKVYKTARANYHAITQGSVDEILGVSPNEYLQ